MWSGYYVQMVAAFLLLSAVHYFAAAFLPIADCDETFNFIEPIHYLLYGSGMQTWENCSQYALRSWLFVWVYAWPATLIRGVTTLSTVDVYFYLRIFNGRIACLCQLFFVYSVWSAFCGRTAIVVLLLLLLNYPIPHASVSVLPTSLAMCCYFVVLGCWLRTGTLAISPWSTTTRKPPTTAAHSRQAAASGRPSSYRCIFFVGSTVFLVVFACIVGWPFAGLVAVPVGLDLLVRFPVHSTLFLLVSCAVIGSASFALDSWYYCQPVLSAWNVVKYNVFGGAERGPELYGVEPWYYFLKNLLLNFHLVFVAALAGPVVVLTKVSSASKTSGVSRGRQLLYMSPFFLWLSFWFLIAHKEERFMAPAYPFLLFSAAIAITQVCFPERSEAVHARLAEVGSPHRSSSDNTANNNNNRKERTLRGRSQSPPRRGLRRLLFICGSVFIALFGIISFSRAMAIYHFYYGPQRLLYDVYANLQHEAEGKRIAQGMQDGDGANQQNSLYTLCVGKEWYRFPSSFFIDHRTMRYGFMKTAAFDGMMPVPFRAMPNTGGLLSLSPHHHSGEGNRDAAGACTCGADGVNDRNMEIDAQYMAPVPEVCDVVFDSLPLEQVVPASEYEANKREIYMSHFPRSLVPNTTATTTHGVKYEYAVLDVDRTPMWCRVLYYPFGISQRCATWRPLILQAKELLNNGKK